MNGLAQVIGCLLMYGIGKNTSLSLAPWRVLFIVCGAMTAASGVAFFFLMPNGPKDAWFLNAREKEVLSMRMAKDREGGDKTSFSVRQLREALLDIKTWFVFAFGVLVTMQSPVLTVRSLKPPRTYLIFINHAYSSPPSSSTPSATTATKQCSTPRLPVLSKSYSSGSAY
jgi:hypothetical protein